MPSISEIRQQYPQYNDMSDVQLADALHSKFYSDMPRDVFDGKVGLGSSQTVAERSDMSGSVPQNARELLPGLINAGAQKIAPETSSYYKIAMDFLNQGSAAGQRTTPNISAQNKNILSANTYENDAGELLYEDPQTGQLVKTDANKHVALRDPADGKIKVYGRNENTDEGVLSSAGRLLGTGLATGAPTRLPSMGAPSALRPMQEVGQAVERLNDAGHDLQIPRAASSDNFITQQAGARLSNVPFIGDPIVKKTDQAIGQLGDIVGDVAKSQGGASMEGAGELASKGIKDWATTKSKALVTKAYDAVDSAVDPSVFSRLNSTQGTIAEIAARRQNAMIPGNSKAVDQVLEAAQNPSGMNYSGIKDLRTSVGELLDNPQMLPAGMRQSELKQIYGSLSDDLKQAVTTAGGPRGLALWERANGINKAVQARREELAKIVGLDGDASPARVFDRIRAAAGSNSRADTNLLLQAKKVIGDDWEEVVSGVTGQLGQNKKGDFSPAVFLNNWQSLSPTGKAALYPSAAHRQALEDIATISRRVAVDLQKLANPSGTARSVAAGGMLTWFLHEPFSAVSSAIGGHLTARVLASPAGASSVANWSRAYQRTVASPGPGAISALNIASRNLANTVNDKFGATVSPGDFLKALQGPMTGRAQDEQP